MDTTQLTTLNRFLSHTYGQGYFIGGQRAGDDPNPLWRLSRCVDLYEYRYVSGRPTLGLKYPWIADEVIILEKNMYAPAPDLVDSERRPHYELVFAFRDNNLNPLDPDEEVLRFLITSLNSSTEAAINEAKYNLKKKHDEAAAEKLAADKRELASQISDISGGISSQLSDGEAVVCPGVQ